MTLDLFPLQAASDGSMYPKSPCTKLGIKDQDSLKVYLLQKFKDPSGSPHTVSNKRISPKIGFFQSQHLISAYKETLHAYPGAGMPVCGGDPFRNALFASTISQRFGV